MGAKHRAPPAVISHFRAGFGPGDALSSQPAPAFALSPLSPARFGCLDQERWGTAAPPAHEQLPGRDLSPSYPSFSLFQSQQGSAGTSGTARSPPAARQPPNIPVGIPKTSPHISQSSPRDLQRRCAHSSHRRRVRVEAKTHHKNKEALHTGCRRDCSPSTFR